MTKTISQEVKTAGMITNQINATQDVKIQDQYSIIIRYITDSVKERRLAIANVRSSRRESMFQEVEKTLELNSVCFKILYWVFYK